MIVELFPLTRQACRVPSRVDKKLDNMEGKVDKYTSFEFGWLPSPIKRANFTWVDKVDKMPGQNKESEESPRTCSECNQELNEADA